MAYTYLIKCIPENKVYYGLRFAKGCEPSELGKTYFSSSKHMKKLFEKYEISDFEFDIRREFIDVDKARFWETRVLKRMNVINRDDFINKTDNISICPKAALLGNKKANSNVSLETRQKRREKMLGRKMSEDTKKKMSIAKKGKQPSDNHFTSNKIAVNGETFPSIKSFYNKYRLDIPYSSLVAKIRKCSGEITIENIKIQRI